MRRWTGCSGVRTAIEKKLAARHLGEGSLVLYDVSSSYFEGTRCPLAKFGHNRDGKKGKLQVNYGLLTDRRGCPVAVSVHEGNTGDTKTLLPQLEKLQRGLRPRDHRPGRRPGHDLPESHRRAQDARRASAGSQRSRAARSEPSWSRGQLQLGLFDEKNLFELAHPDYPGRAPDRLPQPGARQASHAQARSPCSQATEKQLEKIKAMVERATLAGRDKIGLRVGKVVNQYKVAKHFALDIARPALRLPRARPTDRPGSGARRHLHRAHGGAAQRRWTARLRSQLQVPGPGRAGLPLAQDDRSQDPADPPPPGRPGARHILLCMLAYYVEWHMREAWRELLFADEDQAGQGHPRPGGAGHPLRGGTNQGGHAYPRRRQPGAQLLAPCSRTCDDRAQYLPHPWSRIRCADLRGPHYPQREAKTRPRTDPTDPLVARSQNPSLTPSARDAKKNSFRP